MSFWANRLGTNQQPPAPAAPPTVPQPWWMPQQRQAPAPQQQQQQMPPPVQPQAQSVPPDQEAHFGDLLRQDQYTTGKAQSARDTERCPECDSGNYMAAKGHPNAMKQCFNCGYNPRFAHSTAGAPSISQQNTAPPRPARVQTGGESNFNPGQIVGRVS